MTVTHRLKECWLQSGVKLVPGATSEEIHGFEERYGVSLPAEVRDYFTEVGGMAEHGLLDFHPLHAVRSVPEELGDWVGSPDYHDIVNTLPNAKQYFVFADFLIYSHVFALRFCPESLAQSPVIWIYGAEYAPVADSLTQFLEVYLADEETLMYADPRYRGFPRAG